MNTDNRDNFPVALRFQEEAERMAAGSTDEIYGVKCWYCDADLIESGASRVFLGINPAGGAYEKVHDEGLGYLSWPYEKRGYSAWLDEVWTGNGSAHQEATKQAFRCMFGTGWEGELRRTACFNLVPLRTPSAADLSGEVWALGVEWSMAVLQHIGADLIICNGSGESNRSPWGAISKTFGIDVIRRESIGASAYLKEGIIGSGKLNGVRVIGLPFLNRFQRESLWALLRELNM